MRFITTRTHGILDYIVGVALILAPSVLNFDEGGPQTWIPIILGAAAIFYSLITNYELGVIKALPMRAHLGLDIASGILLAASPWLFGFADRVWAPHLIVGLFEIVAGISTHTVPSTNTLQSRRT